jgi:hypothetical protein
MLDLLSIELHYFFQFTFYEIITDS